MKSPGSLHLIPAYHERVWGGQRLKAADGCPQGAIGEAWIVYEHNRIACGPEAGRTLAEVTAEYGEALLGSRGEALGGRRFPLLIKLLDTSDWLSLQVHPNDEQAARLEGPGQLGKTEAWHLLEVEAGGRVICGLRDGVTAETVARAIREGGILDLIDYLPVQAGDTIFTRPGTIHALGPGLLLYEVQQTSDLTYRVFDWNRPQSAGRALHIDKSLAVVDPGAIGRASACPELAVGERTTLTACPYFTLTLAAGGDRPIHLDPAGETFHAVTVIEGEAHLVGDGWRVQLGRFETVVVPANAGPYTLHSERGCRALSASIEECAAEA